MPDFLLPELRCSKRNFWKCIPVTKFDVGTEWKEKMNFPDGTKPMMCFSLKKNLEFSVFTEVTGSLRICFVHVFFVVFEHQDILAPHAAF